jgi:4-hydroxybenzoate polyprenyltransferase/putative flippase GtrA
MNAQADLAGVKTLRGDFARFILAGGIAAVVNWLSRFAFSQFMSLSAAVGAAYLVGMSTAFVLTRSFVFERSGRDIHHEYLRFALVNVVALAQVWLVTVGLAEYVFPALGLNWHAEALAHGIGVLVPAVTSYFGHRHFTFARRDPAEALQGLPSKVSESLPLVVELESALLKTDMVVEAMVAALFARPLATAPALVRHRAAFKGQVAEPKHVDAATLPLRQDVLDYLTSQRESGRELHLISSGHPSIAQAIGARLGIFTYVLGADLASDQSSERVRQVLERCPHGFTYAGGRGTKPEMWRHAAGVVLVGASNRLAHTIRAMGKCVERQFSDAGLRSRVWRRALRTHQWSKNILLFVPFLLSPAHSDPGAGLKALIGFVLTGVAASGTYLLNDVRDLPADRHHESKRFRPVANGDISIVAALICAVLLIALALALASVLSRAFGITLACYVATTVTYSLWLKRIALLDVIVLAALYVVRLVMGTVLVGVVFSPWLMTFAAFFFCSMSLAKRHVEIVAASDASAELIRGRGYMPSDGPLTLALGVAFGIASILIVVEYLMSEAFPSGMYHAPMFLWAAPVILGGWICRVWLLAHRGMLHADPVAFALRDGVSLVLGAAMAGAFVSALTL